MPEIRIVVDKDGNTTIDCIGYKGKACEDLPIKQLEDALGTSQQTTRKSEYYVKEDLQKIKLQK